MNATPALHSWQDMARVPRRQRGIALFVGMVFLIVLSLVAIIAMQSTFLEMRMSANVARHEEAFQVSESGRLLVGPFLDQNMFNRGWPSSWGGTVPDSAFDWSNINTNLVTAFETALGAGSGATKNLYGAVDTPGANGATVEDPTNPTTWVSDLNLSVGDPNHDYTDDLASALSFVPDGTAINQGSGSAQSAGYEGLGVGSGSGGASRYVEVQSVGTAPANGRAVTIAQYRAVLK